jgi:hypothetical protein
MLSGWRSWPRSVVVDISDESDKTQETLLFKELQLRYKLEKIVTFVTLRWDTGFLLYYRDQNSWEGGAELDVNKDGLLSESPITNLPWSPFLVARPKWDRLRSTVCWV